MNTEFRKLNNKEAGSITAGFDNARQMYYLQQKYKERQEQEKKNAGN